MKAKVIATGEIVNLVPYAIVKGTTFYKETPEEELRLFKDKELEFVDDSIKINSGKSIDWEQRKFELVKATMQGLSANPYEDIIRMDEDTLADLAISYADAVIAKLKEE